MNASEQTPSNLSHATDKLMPGPGFWVSRALIYVCFLLIVVMVAWASVTRVDVVVKTRGRLAVEGEVIRITSVEPGYVTEVAVSIGDRVAKDSLIMQLDFFKPRSDAERIAAEISAIRTQQDGFHQSAIADRQSAASLQDEAALTESSIAILSNQARTFQDLARDKVFSPLEAQQKERELMDARGRLARLKSEMRQKENDAAQKARSAEEAEAKTIALEIQMGQFGEAERRTSITAPEAGVITHLAVKHPGSMLQTSEPAVQIAPDGRPIMARLAIPNKLMRRVRGGMKVRLRFDALPHQDYGFVDGTLLRIDPDVDKEGAYAAIASLDKTILTGRYGAERLRVGLDCDADIVIEQRSLLDTILRPFKELDQPLRMSE